MRNRISVDGRLIGEEYEPFVVAEIGINHEGNYQKAKKMIKDAHEVGAECIKFQCHILEHGHLWRTSLRK